jgi:N-methylhydantoinase A
MTYVVGIDVGGTFTDCVLIDEAGNVLFDKSFTVPGSPGHGMVNALENVTTGRGLPVNDVLGKARAVALGTTSLTNKLITRGGAKVGLITTKGHEDAILIGRIISKSDGLSEAERSDVLCWSKPDPIVSRGLIRGINERIDYKGAVIVALDEGEVETIVRELVESGSEAIAVSLLWSFVNRSHERRIQEIIQRIFPSLYIALSSNVAPVLGEYERTNATILSAHLGALARREIDMTSRLLATRGLSRPLLVMQSNGGCMWGEDVETAPLNLVASGPAGGIIGAAKLGEQMGYRNVIGTDMGGTSFDVGVIVEGAPIFSEIAIHGRVRMALPHVEVVSIGAGGGSIARVDPATGLLEVGPQTAGAVPGPVAYDEGGLEPTVTDADVVLGRIDPARFFNGRKLLDRAKAETAIKTRIADPLGWDVFRAAKGIIDIVDSRMGDLIRKLTIESGVDPRDFVLFAYGGAGPTHVGAFAKEVGIKKAVVPPFASVFSAVGIASSDIVRIYSNSSPLRSPFDPGRITALFMSLQDQAEDDLMRKGVMLGATRLSRSLEMRFRHQAYHLKVPVPDGAIDRHQVDCIVDRFIEAYEQNFGRGTAVTEAGVEIITFHVVATTRPGTLSLREASLGGADSGAAQSGMRRVYFEGGFVNAPIYEHAKLAPGNRVAGPAIVEGANTTLPLHPGQELMVDGFQNLVIHFSDVTP